MRIWLCVRLPFLPLQVLRPRWTGPSEHGFAVLDADKVLLADRTAREAGVRAGMRKGGALTLLPDIELQPRRPAQEHETVEALALALLQYTPNVAIQSENAVVMEVAASLRLFGGIRALYRQVKSTLDAFGCSSSVSIAPTAAGAWLLTHARRRRVLKLHTLERELATLPVALLPTTRPHLGWLTGIGCEAIEQLRKLPRAGLKRRCGEDLLDELDRVTGEAPELYDWFEAPPVFDVKVELPARIEHAEAILFSARRLMTQMTGWLAARQFAITRYFLYLDHERGRQAVPPSSVEVALGTPAWKEEHLVRLLRERLGRLTLEAPVIGVRLEARDVRPLEVPSTELFPEPGGTREDHSRLVELLTARLGAENVLCAAPVADHRPEIASRWVPIGEAAKPVQPPGDLPRPGWLLEEPIQLSVRQNRPFYGSALRMASSSERIECGWWDGNIVTRDYFVAQGEDNAYYWIFQERIGSRDAEKTARWFLHGLFS
jgi:protein ImuB